VRDEMEEFGKVWSQYMFMKALSIFSIVGLCLLLDSAYCWTKWRIDPLESFF
jgi:hypothetical protein